MRTSPSQVLLGLILGAAAGLGAGYALFGESTPPVRAAASLPGAPAPATRGAASATPNRAADTTNDRAAAAQRERSATPIAVDSQRVRDLVARLEPEARASLTPPAGSGAIWGRALDDEQQPIEGVVLRLTRLQARSSARSPGAVGAAPPRLDDLEDVVREAVERHVEARSGTRETSTDASGSYRFTDLPEGPWRIEAFKRDWILEAVGRGGRSVDPGTELDFEGQQVVVVAVQVVLPDGSTPDSAEVSIERQGPEGRGVQAFTWTPRQPELRVAQGRYELTARAEPFNVGTQVRHALASEPESVGLYLNETPPPLRLVLQPVSGILGRLVRARDDYGGSRPYVQIVALGPTEEPTPERVDKSDERDSVGEDGRFAFLDLKPGRHALGVKRSWNDAIEALEVVEVGEGIAEVTLELPPIDLSKRILVTALGPDAQLLDDVRVRIRVHMKNGGGWSSSTTPVRAKTGEYIVTLDAQHQDAYFEGSDSIDVTLTLIHGEYGERSVDLAPAQTEVTVTFGVPAALEVLVPNYAGSPYEGRVYLSLTARGEDVEGLWDRKQLLVTPEGTCEFEAVETGAWSLNLEIEEDDPQAWAQKRIVAALPVDLVAGPNRVNFSIPPLYDLVVRLPDVEDGTDISVSGNGRSFRENAEFQGELATFSGLPAGTYTLSTWSPYRHMEVEVPCGEVLFEAEAVDALLVSITDGAGHLAQAGLRDGDLIVGVDDFEFATLEDTRVLYGRKAGRLALLRDGASVSLDFEDVAWSDWADLGGSLEPAARPR